MLICNLQLFLLSLVKNPESLPEVQIDIHQALVQKAVEGNPQAMKEIYRLYSKSMFNICCRMMNNTTDAEDMLQEVFIEAFSRLNSFRFESTFGAWLKRITINKCINELRRRKVALELRDQPFSEDMAEEIDSDYDNLELTVERVKHAMGLLPDGYRVVFSLYMLEGYDHEEIASILGISESTSKTQLMRARKKLVNILNAGSLMRTTNN